MATGTHGGRIGVDLGGTVTDLVWVDDTTGAIRVGKLLTTPKEPAQAVDRYARRAGATLSDPAIVEERESTAVIGPDARSAVDASLTLLAVPA
jgi:N-methylhydantoinase A/oxoprolinase/acetone carboxylase beta subunit